MTNETITSLNTNYIFSVKITSCSLRSYLKSKTNTTVTMWSCERNWNQNPKSPCVNKRPAYTANTHTRTTQTVLCVWESVCVVMRRWGQRRSISTLTHFNSEHHVQRSWWKQTHTHTSIIVRKFMNNSFTSPEVCEKKTRRMTKLSMWWNYHVCDENITSVMKISWENIMYVRKISSMSEKYQACDENMTWQNYNVTKYKKHTIYQIIII